MLNGNVFLSLVSILIQNKNKSLQIKKQRHQMAEDLHLNVPSTTYETGRDGRITRGSLKSFMMSTACNLRAPGDTRLPAGCYSTRGVFCESERIKKMDLFVF